MCHRRAIKDFARKSGGINVLPSYVCYIRRPFRGSACLSLNFEICFTLLKRFSFRLKKKPAPGAREGSRVCQENLHFEVLFEVVLEVVLELDFEVVLRAILDLHFDVKNDAKNHSQNLLFDIKKWTKRCRN